MRPVSRRTALVSAGLACIARPSMAQAPVDYPTKPVRLVVGFSAGGGTDTVARLIAARLTEMWGQTFVVDNRTGAGGRIASEVVAKARPDGTTVLFASASFAIDAAMYHNLAFDPIAGFKPVTMVASAPYVLVVNPAVPATSVAELIALAKRQPGTLNEASAGPGSTLDMAFRLFRSMAGVDIVEVNYQGANGIPDLVAGRVQMTIAALPQLAAYIRSGQLRALAVTTAKRSSLAPDLPTIAESGLPGYDVTPWYGVLVPGRTPDEIVAKLQAGIAAVLAEPETRARFAAAGMEPLGSTPDAFAQTLKTEIGQWTSIAAAAKLSSD
jgi:tripartite-type tricarboxylate transporter receptor subunit TctC